MGLFNAEYQEGFQSNIIEGIGWEAPESLQHSLHSKTIKVNRKNWQEIIMPPSEENILIGSIHGKRNYFVRL